MSKTRQIKVIKKSDVVIAQTSRNKKKSPKKDTRREMSSTVSEWVKELQKRPINQF